MKTWWLSYAGLVENRGVILVDADTFFEACAEVNKRGLSPGGQVLGNEVSDPVHAPPEFKEWLKTAPRLKLLGLKDMPPEVEADTLEGHAKQDNEK